MLPVNILHVRATASPCNRNDHLLLVKKAFKWRKIGTKPAFKQLEIKVYERCRATLRVRLREIPFAGIVSDTPLYSL